MAQAEMLPKALWKRYSIFTSIPFILHFIGCLAVQQNISSMFCTLMWCASPMIHLYFVLPLLDLYFGLPREPVAKEEIAKHKITTTTTTTTKDSRAQRERDNMWYRVLLWAMAPGLISVLSCTLSLSVQYQYHPTIILLSLSLGAIGGMVIAASHELLHSSHSVDRYLASFLLSSVCYGHWSTSHITHHTWVNFI